jgi:hypothetical protein
MSNETPRLKSVPEVQTPQQNIDKNFQKFFLQEQPFLLENHETSEAFKQSYMAFNQAILPAVRRLSSPNQSPESVIEKLNHSASLVMSQTANSLGYSSDSKVEIAKVDILAVDGTLGLLASQINQDAATQKPLSEITKDINLVFNPQVNLKERRDHLNAFMKSAEDMPSDEFLQPKNQLIIATLEESKLITLVEGLLKKPDQNSAKLTHIAHNLPTSNLTLVSAQILDAYNQNPANTNLKNLFLKITSEDRRSEKELQKELFTNISEINPKLDYGRGWEGLSQNKIFLGLSYVWSMLTFLSNSILAGSMMLGKEKNSQAILKALGLATAAGSVMGVTGTALLTGKPPLKVAENFLTQAFNYLSFSKEDIDSMNAQEVKVTVPRLLDQSGPYIASIFTDDDIIQSLTSTNTIIEGSEPLTDKTANQKLHNLYLEIKKKSPEKAEFFKNNFLKPAEKNPQQSLLLVYFIQKSYNMEGVGITSHKSFLSKLNQDPEKYPSIADFNSLQNE